MIARLQVAHVSCLLLPSCLEDLCFSELWQKKPTAGSLASSNSELTSYEVIL